MRIIEDEHELPVEGDFVRSKCDPHILIAGRSGETYHRRDGNAWEWPGYRIAENRDTRCVEREPCTGIEDLTRLRPDGAVESVEHRKAAKKVA